MTAAKPRIELELRPVEAPPHASAGACVYVLLPTLDELLGCPGFARHQAICLPGIARPLDGWSLFGHVRSRGLTLH